jgi:hypothetical protein
VEDLNDALRYVYLTQEQYDSIYNKSEENKKEGLKMTEDFLDLKNKFEKQKEEVHETINELDKFFEDKGYNINNKEEDSKK